MVWSFLHIPARLLIGMHFLLREQEMMMQIMDKYVQAGEALAWKENEVLDLTKQVSYSSTFAFHSMGTEAQHKSRITFVTPLLANRSTSFFAIYLHIEVWFALRSIKYFRRRHRKLSETTIVASTIGFIRQGRNVTFHACCMREIVKVRASRCASFNLSLEGWWGCTKMEYGQNFLVYRANSCSCI